MLRVNEVSSENVPDLELKRQFANFPETARSPLLGIPKDGATTRSFDLVRQSRMLPFAPKLHGVFIFLPSPNF